MLVKQCKSSFVQLINGLVGGKQIESMFISEKLCSFAQQLKMELTASKIGKHR